MDTLQNLDALLASIKSDMPKTYAMIKEAAAKQAGIYKQVRRGLLGEAGCFYARERKTRPGQLETWLVAGCRDGFVDLLPDVFHKSFDQFVDVVFFLPDQASVQALSQSRGSQHAN